MYVKWLRLMWQPNARLSLWHNGRNWMSPPNPSFHWSACEGNRVFVCFLCVEEGALSADASKLPLKMHANREEGICVRTQPLFLLLWSIISDAFPCGEKADVAVVNQRCQRSNSDSKHQNTIFTISSHAWHGWNRSTEDGNDRRTIKSRPHKLIGNKVYVGKH